MRVSGTWARLAAAALACAVLAAPSAAGAQSLFQSLFGGSSPPLPQAPQARVIPPSKLASPYPGQRQFGPAAAADQGERAPASRQSGEGKGGYRTVCVRLCDGYYWPVSASTSRSRFYRDSNTCRSSCGGEAKLYYQSAGDGDAKGLIDLQGRPYSRIQTAFLYRKTLVQGCACKPEPWSQAELDRHFRYAVAAGLTDASAPRPATAAAVVVAGAAAPPAPSPAPQMQAATETGEGPSAGAAVHADAADTTSSHAGGEARRPVRAALVTTEAPLTAARARPAAARPHAQGPSKAPARHAAQKVPAATAQPRPQVAKAAAKPLAAQSASLFGGPSKYTWPGDPPTRYR